MSNRLMIYYVNFDSDRLAYQRVTVFSSERKL